MDAMINGRKPEEIKTALKVCPEDINDCPLCPYTLSFTCRDNVMLDALALIERLESERDAALEKVPRWISVEERKPKGFASVQVYMTDAGDFPSVREGYYVDEDRFYIPALHEFHPVSHWKPFDEPPEEGA